MHAVAVRSARAARIGARAGRLSRPLRLLNRLLKREELDTAEAGYSAKMIGRKLTTVFSSKVAMLTVVLVLGVPVFNIGRFPEDDFSMKSWGTKIEEDYARDYGFAADGDKDAAHAFQHSIHDMSIFYSTIDDYFPYHLQGYPSHITVHGKTVSIEAAKLISTEAPNRKQNIVRQDVSKCLLVRPGCDDEEKAAVYFNFTEQNQCDYRSDMYVTIFIIMCMLLESLDLSFSIDRMMVRPMERMLDSARLMSKQLNQAMSRGKAGKMQDAAKNMTKELMTMDRDGDEDDEEEEDDTQNEIEALQELFKKVVFLINVFMEQDVTEQIADVDDASQGVMVDVAQNMDAKKSMFWANQGEPSQGLEKAEIGGSSSEIGESASSAVIPVAIPKSPVKVISVDCADEKSVQSWAFNVFDLDPAERDKKVKDIMFTSDMGVKTGILYIKPPVFDAFCKEVEAGYLQIPYHNYAHAVEVYCSTYRWLRQMQWQVWLSDLDATALLTAALVGDIGHPGRTNHFLVETSHQLALSYNDTSPLENMHCAKFFEILSSKPEANIFASQSKNRMKHVRAVIIEAILHTDNALHFELLKKIKSVYGMASDMCDAQANSPSTLATQYVTDVLQEQTPLWRKVCLHLADISNPALKFPVAKLWAKGIIEEFFAQGDEEKSLGIPVGMLNDRNKASLPGSQFGFNSMLFTPLVVNVLYVFPTIRPIFEKTIENAELWLSEWEKEPGYKEGAQHDKVRKFKEQLSRFAELQDGTEEQDKIRGQKSMAKSRGLGTKQSMFVEIETAGIAKLAGSWTCIGTNGLEEFLKSTNVSWPRRKFAMAAPWPTWDFQQNGDHIVFVNNTAMGVIREEITATNEPFIVIDGWKQEVHCKSYWEAGALVIEKSVPSASGQPKWIEHRRIDSYGKLQFSLQPIQPAGPKWGRTFELKKRR